MSNPMSALGHKRTLPGPFAMSPFTSESQARAKGRHYQVIGKAIHVQHCLVMAPNRTAGDASECTPFSRMLRRVIIFIVTPGAL